MQSQELLARLPGGLGVHIMKAYEAGLPLEAAALVEDVNVANTFEVRVMRPCSFCHVHALQGVTTTGHELVHYFPDTPALFLLFLFLQDTIGQIVLCTENHAALVAVVQQHVDAFNSAGPAVVVNAFLALFFRLRETWKENNFNGAKLDEKGLAAIGSALEAAEVVATAQRAISQCAAEVEAESLRADMRAMKERVGKLEVDMRAAKEGQAMVNVAQEETNANVAASQQRTDEHLAKMQAQLAELLAEKEVREAQAASACDGGSTGPVDTAAFMCHLKGETLGC